MGFEIESQLLGRDSGNEDLYGNLGLRAILITALIITMKCLLIIQLVLVFVFAFDFHILFNLSYNTLVYNYNKVFLVI